MMSHTSSQSLSRSVLTSEATVPGKEHPITPSAHVSPLPFLVCSLYGQPFDFLRFLPGAFRRQGTVLGQGATFSVEKHTLRDIGRGMIDDLVHGDDHFTRWPVIAIKRLRSKHHIPWKSLEAIEREMIALKLLKGAENIVQLIGLGWEVAPVGGDSRLWPVLILEYAENGTLADLQSTSEPVSYELKRKLCVDVARGLLRLHRTGIAHGDLKSENILIFGAPGDKYVAKISDFGYAGLDYQEHDTASGKSSDRPFFIPGGTELWSAPEYGKPTSKIGFMKQDIYSWGLTVLRTMMDGRSPFLAHSSYSNRDGQSSLGPTILSIKKSGEKDRKRWVETCLNTRSCAEDISTNCQILLKVILPCLSLEPEVRNLASSMRIWEIDPWDLEWTPKGASSDSIWPSMQFQCFQRLPLKVQTQYLSDCATIALLPPLSSTKESSRSSYASTHLVLAQSKLIKTLQKGYGNSYEATIPEVVRVAVLEMIKDCSLQGDPWAMVISSTQSNLVHENQSRIELRCSGLQPHQKKDRSSKARDSEVQIVAYKRGVFGLVPCEIGSKLQKAEQLKGTMWDRTALGAAFHGACSSGLEDVVRLLYKQRTGSLDLENMLTRDDTMEETALLKACRSGSYSIVLFLLAQGGDPNKVRARQDSPLHWLCAFEGPEVPKIASALVKAGADLKTQATAIVCQWDEVNCPELSFASGTPLHRAVSRRCWEAVNCLLELGADPNERSNFAPHDTPITLAVSLYLHGPESTRCRHLERNKQKSILEVLLAKSTDFKPNQQYLVCGRTRLPSFILRLATLQRTAMYGWRHAVSVTATLDLLEKLGERFSDPASGYSLLHLAIQAGDIDVVAYLLQKYRRDDINLTFKYGDAFWHPPLFYAINGGHFEIFMHLLRCGADPFQRFQTDYILGGTGVPLERLFYAGENMEDFERGRIRGPRSTYLHICATSGAGKRFATKLLNQGCKLNSYDSNWESPLFLSVINCDFELADFFVEYGASTELLRDDRTMLGHLVEDGFLAPYAAFDYLLKAQLKFGPKGSTGFMAVYKEYRTWLHVLMDFWDTFRNPDWAEALFDLFARRLPDTRLLDIQIDMYGDTVLHFAIGSINILAVKRLLHWGADPNVPNYKVGISCDLVLKMVFDTMSKHGITGQTLKAQSFPESSLKSAVQEVRGLEEIFQLLKSHGGLCTRGTPPWEKDFNMSNIGEDGKEVRRREELGVDLRSINDETDTTDGPCQEICNEIAEDMNKQIAGKQLDWNGLSVITTRIIICHLLKAPEVAYTSRRLFRFEQYLGTLIGSFASLHLEFDRKLYGWRIELNRIPGGGIPGAYVLSPPTKSETELPLHSLKPEHQLSLANRRADLAKLNVDVCTSPLHTKISVPISQWEPLANAPQERRPSALRLKESLSASKADLSGRGKLGPVSMIRLKQLLPSDGYRVIIGAGDELADLMYPDRPPPAGTRILVSTLTSGSIISFTVAAEGKPARHVFMNKVPNMRYWRRADEMRISSTNSYNDLPSSPPTSSPSLSPSSSKARQVTESKEETSSRGSWDTLGIKKLVPKTLEEGEVNISPQVESSSRLSSGRRRGRPSRAQQEADSSSRNTAGSQGDSNDTIAEEDRDPMSALAMRVLEQEGIRKEQIEAKGLPPGKLWWEMRHLADE